MSADGAGRPAASGEGLLAAVVLAVVSLLLAATLPWDRIGETGGDASPASHSAGRQ